MLKNIGNVRAALAENQRSDCSLNVCSWKMEPFVKLEHLRKDLCARFAARTLMVEQLEN